MIKIMVALIGAMLVTGCGYVERSAASISGGGFESCVDGVVYLQFTSGATVKYTPDGKIQTCKE